MFINKRRGRRYRSARSQAQRRYRVNQEYKRIQYMNSPQYQEDLKRKEFREKVTKAENVLQLLKRHKKNLKIYKKELEELENKYLETQGFIVGIKYSLKARQYNQTVWHHNNCLKMLEGEYSKIVKLMKWDIYEDVED